MGTSFSFRYEDEYKPLRQLIHMLVEVVAKGGNLALNVGPQPDGRLPEGAIRRMKELGAWLKVYGESIYGTRICAPYYTGEWAFTCKGSHVYGFHLYPSEDAVLTEWVELPYKEEVSEVVLLGATPITLEWKREGEGIAVKLPEFQLQGPVPVAHVFRLSHGTYPIGER